MTLGSKKMIHLTHSKKKKEIFSRDFSSHRSDTFQVFRGLNRRWRVKTCRDESYNKITKREIQGEGANELAKISNVSLKMLPALQSIHRGGLCLTCWHC